jgi:hypothetical protein
MPMPARAIEPGSGTAVIEIEAGRLDPDESHDEPLSVESFVTGLNGDQPLAFCEVGKSPSLLNTQLNKDPRSGDDTTSQ